MSRCPLHLVSLRGRHLIKVVVWSAFSLFQQTCIHISRCLLFIDMLAVDPAAYSVEACCVSLLFWSLPLPPLLLSPVLLDANWFVGGTTTLLTITLTKHTAWRLEKHTAWLHLMGSTDWNRHLQIFIVIRYAMKLSQDVLLSALTMHARSILLMRKTRLKLCDEHEPLRRQNFQHCCYVLCLLTTY